MRCLDRGYEYKRKGDEFGPKKLQNESGSHEDGYSEDEVLALFKILLCKRIKLEGEELKEYDQDIHDHFLADHASFAGACRAAIAEPALIGLDELAPIQLTHND